MSPTGLKLESPSQWWIHNAFHESLIEFICIASNPIRDPPDLDALVTDEDQLGYDVEGYEYPIEYNPEQVMGSHFNKEWKKDLYLVKWKGYPEETDWTEEAYENFDNKKLLKEFHERNPQTAKDITLLVEFVPFLLGDIVVPGGFNSNQ